MIATLAKLPPARQRFLAVGLLVAVAAIALSVVLVPLWSLHKHYDDAIAELNDRIERYRRIAAQAPEYRKALDAMRAKDGRRFFLKNTAPNLAGAELQEQVRAAIESNGGRITTSQNQGPKDDGRFRQITVTVIWRNRPSSLGPWFWLVVMRPPLLSMAARTSSCNSAPARLGAAFLRKKRRPSFSRIESSALRYSGACAATRP